MGAFRPNPRFESELRKDAAYRRGLEETATPLVNQIKAIAPVGPTGNYRDSIEIGQEGDEVRLGSTDVAGHLVEWGSAKNPPYAPIRRGIRAAGLRLDESPKP